MITDMPTNMSKQMTASKRKRISAKSFDRKVEAGEDVSAFFDMNSGTKRVSVDFPIRVFRELEKEARRRTISLQDLVKTWVVDGLDRK